MFSSLMLNTALSIPLSALLSFLMKKRYACARAACGAAFLLGVALVMTFSLTGITPMSGLHFRVRLSEIQLLPFSDWQFSGIPEALMNIGGNLVLLMPFAFLTSLLFPEHRGLGRQLLLGLGLSLTIECLQLFLSRATDLSDVLLNTAGCAAGYGLSRLFARRFPQWAARMEVRGTQCILCAYVLSTLLLPIAVGVIELIRYIG